jgi:hypothetical protein
LPKGKGFIALVHDSGNPNLTSTPMPTSIAELLGYDGTFTPTWRAPTGPRLRHAPARAAVVAIAPVARVENANPERQPGRDAASFVQEVARPPTRS